MRFVNTKAFVTPLIVLSAVIIPATSNAQSILSGCSNTENVNDRLTMQPNTALSSPCLQDAVETIYNPNSHWQSNL